MSDYYAHAIGGGLHYETAIFHEFQFGIGGSSVFNLGSSDLTKIDNTTGQNNRYEIGLFDVENLNNKNNINRLEELFLKYHFQKSYLNFGRQFINTPFINLQDGRMRPTSVSGFWFELNEIKNTRIEAGWLNAISPRGTSRWFDFGESLGIYPLGVNQDGTKSGYKNNINCKGVALLGLQYIGIKNLKLQIWEMIAENLFNASLLQVDLNVNLKNDYTAFAAAQFIREVAIGNGGNEELSKTYISKSANAISYGAKAGLKNSIWDASLNYNRIGAQGLYLMPREWGRDPFFTFLPRERNEGLGDVHAFVGKLQYNISKARIKTSLAFGYYDLPDVKNFALNKYGMPSYTQFNLDLRYRFKGLMEGLEIQILIVDKQNAGKTYQNEKYVFNKVNLMIYNLIINYHF